MQLQSAEKTNARLGQIIDLDERRRQKNPNREYCPNVHSHHNVPESTAIGQTPELTADNWFRLGDLLPEVLERAGRARAGRREVEE